jgi:hypothetical protein
MRVYAHLYVYMSERARDLELVTIDSLVSTASCFLLREFSSTTNVGHIPLGHRQVSAFVSLPVLVLDLDLVLVLVLVLVCVRENLKTHQKIFA